MRRILIMTVQAALLGLALLLNACDYVPLEPARACTSPLSAKDQQVACDGIEFCVSYESTQDPRRPEACCDKPDAAACRRWALEDTLCHILVERCICALH